MYQPLSDNSEQSEPTAARCGEKQHGFERKSARRLENSASTAENSTSTADFPPMRIQKRLPNLEVGNRCSK